MERGQNWEILKDIYPLLQEFEGVFVELRIVHKASEHSENRAEFGVSCGDFDFVTPITERKLIVSHLLEILLVLFPNFVGDTHESEVVHSGVRCHSLVF